MPDTTTSPVDTPSGIDPAFAHVETWLFDLDNTLYSANAGVFKQVHKRMGEFIAREYNLSETEAKALQREYFLTHGTTLRGLMTEKKLPPKLFLDYVHDIDLTVIDPRPDVVAAFDRLPGRKLIYTNATAGYAGRILDRLGLTGHFEAIFDIEAADFIPKPEPGPYQVLVDRFGVEPAATCMVEDMPGNLAPAAAMGMTTVWIREDSDMAFHSAGPKGGIETVRKAPPEPPDHVHHLIENLADWLHSVVRATR